MDNIPQILLAAGASSRMGSPKPLLSWGSQKLIEYQINKLLATEQKVCVVLGAYASEIKPIIEHLPITIVINNQWEQGMGTSIAVGVAEVKKRIPNAEAVLISTIDQPMVTTDYLLEIIQIFEKNTSQIIVSESNKGWKGVPVLFDRYFFDELEVLGGDKGAKSIINKSNVLSIHAGDLLEDMDTPEIYNKLLKRFNLQS